MVRASVCTGHDTSTPGAWPRASERGAQAPLVLRWGRRRTSRLTDERASDEPDSRTLRECGEELVGAGRRPARDRGGASMRTIIVAAAPAPRRHPRRRSASMNGRRSYADGGLALPARSRQRRLGAQLDGRHVGRRRHRRRARRPRGTPMPRPCPAAGASPSHTSYVSTRAWPGRKRGRQCLSHAPAREPFRQPDIEELGPRRGWWPRAELRRRTAAWPGARPARQPAGPMPPGLPPRRLLGPLGEIGIQRSARKDEPPALDGLARRRHRDRRRGVSATNHAC